VLLYSIDRPVTPEQFRDLLVRSTLGERRPIDDAETIAGMVANGTLCVTCWDGDLLVGIARSVTDFHYCCYLSDLAVDEGCQRQGIGKELIARTKAALGPLCKLILLSAPAAQSYYPRLGFQKHDSAWVLD
jgi:ribosomal protein S18 acetylase RimI-like enzyme